MRFSVGRPKGAVGQIMALGNARERRHAAATSPRKAGDQNEVFDVGLANLNLTKCGIHHASALYGMRVPSGSQGVAAIEETLDRLSTTHA